MSTQPSLNFESLSRRSDPPSSKRAARKAVESGAAQSNCARLFKLMQRFPGRTSKQLALLGDIDRTEAGRRCSTLYDKGHALKVQIGKKELKWYAIL